MITFDSPLLDLTDAVEQETVARVHALAKPPRRLVMRHLDGSGNRLPARGAHLVLSGGTVESVGTSSRQLGLGPIALGMVKCHVALDVVLPAEGAEIVEHLRRTFR